MDITIKMSDNKQLKEKLQTAINMKKMSRVNKQEKERQEEVMYKKMGVTKQQVEEFHKMFSKNQKKSLNKDE